MKQASANAQGHSVHHAKLHVHCIARTSKSGLSSIHPAPRVCAGQPASCVLVMRLMHPPGIITALQGASGQSGLIGTCRRGSARPHRLSRNSMVQAKPVHNGHGPRDDASAKRKLSSPAAQHATCQLPQATHAGVGAEAQSPAPLAPPPTRPRRQPAQR